MVISRPLCSVLVPLIGSKTKVSTTWCIRNNNNNNDGDADDDDDDDFFAPNKYHQSRSNHDFPNRIATEILFELK